MARKKREQTSESIKPIEEMTDAEFITYADYLSSPYYRAYVAANCRYDAPEGVNPMSRDMRGAPNDVKKQGKKGKAVKLYEGKRNVLLVLIAIFMFITLVISIIGFVKIEAISPYVSIYNIPKIKSSSSDGEGEGKTVYEAISVADPIMGVFGLTDSFDGNENSYFYRYFLANFDTQSVLTKITLLAVPIAAMMVVVFSLIGLVKAIIALCAKKEYDGYYKKYKFGFLSVAMFLCGLIFLFGGMFVSGIKFADFSEFILFKSKVMQAGYMLYAMIILPLLTFVFTCFGYKRKK